MPGVRYFPYPILLLIKIVDFPGKLHSDCRCSPGSLFFIQYEILLLVGFTMSKVPRLVDSEFSLKISSNKRKKNLFHDAIRKLSG